MLWIISFFSMKAVFVGKNYYSEWSTKWSKKNNKLLLPNYHSLGRGLELYIIVATLSSDLSLAQEDQHLVKTLSFASGNEMTMTINMWVQSSEIHIGKLRFPISSLRLPNSGLHVAAKSEFCKLIQMACIRFIWVGFLDQIFSIYFLSIEWNLR